MAEMMKKYIINTKRQKINSFNKFNLNCRIGFKPVTQYTLYDLDYLADKYTRY